MWHIYIAFFGLHNIKVRRVNGVFLLGYKVFFMLCLNIWTLLFNAEWKGAKQWSWFRVTEVSLFFSHCYPSRSFMVNLYNIICFWSNMADGLEASLLVGFALTCNSILIMKTFLKLSFALTPELSGQNKQDRRLHRDMFLDSLYLVSGPSSLWDVVDVVHPPLAVWLLNIYLSFHPIIKACMWSAATVYF